MRPELCLLLLVATSGFAAQEPKPAAEAMLQLISLVGDRDDLALWDGRKATPVRLSADFFGRRISYAGDSRLQLIQRPKSPPPPRPPGERPTHPRKPETPPGPPVAWLDLPPSSEPHQLILLVHPDDGSNGIHALKDTPEDFPRGSIRLMNLCDFPVWLEEGQQVTEVPAKDSSVVRPGVPNFTYFNAAIYSEEDHERRLAHNLHFFHSKERRTMMFILPVEKGTGLVRLQPFEEPLPPLAANLPADGKPKPPRGIK
jgi:hypothetical protein